MVPSVVKEVFVPGSLTFLVITLIAGTALLYRKNGRAGRILLTAVALFYWALTTPAVAIPLIRILTPGYPPVMSREQARGAQAIVVLGAGVDVFRSRGDRAEISTREDALRTMEAARVYRLLDRPWVIVTGGLGIRRRTDAEHMAIELEQMGVPADRIVQERQASNTHEHGIYVPPLLRQHAVTQFVLVTSRQHIARSLHVFRKVGWSPVASTPDEWDPPLDWWTWLLPSRQALSASQSLMYDQVGSVYYWIRGW